MDEYPRIAVVADRVERLDLDSSGKPCSEGYFAVDPSQRGVVLMPPSAEFPTSAKGYEPGKRQGLRLATRAEVDAGPIAQACSEQIAGNDPSPSPSDRKA